MRVGCDRLFWTLSLPLNHLFQHRMARLIQFQDQLAEERVGPGKPGAGEFLWVVLIERLVHESGSVMRGLKHPETRQNLVVTGAGQGPHDNSQRPDHVQTDVRSTDAFGSFAAKEVRIVIAQDLRSSVAIDRVVRGHATQIWQREQARNIRIIHEELVAESIYLVGVNHSMRAARGLSIFVHGLTYLMYQLATLRRERSIG